jgi:hypothetical protein
MPAVTVATPKPISFWSHIEAFWSHITARQYLYCLTVVGLFNLVLILLNICLRTTYIKAYPQDIFMTLDGMYRIYAGQHIYADFSTPLGIALYYVPLLFVHSASDLVLSINYASGLYLLIGFVVVAYLTWTRLSPVLGLALGIWIALALAARMNGGDSPMAVTLAENYNRNCLAALALALLVFRTPRGTGLMIAIADGLLYALLTAFCLYTKITYGLVALAFAPIVIYPHPRRLVTFSSFASAFGLLVVAVEYGYGTRFQWLQAVQTAAGAGSLLSPGPIAGVVFENLGELLVCVLVPAWFLWRERRITPRTVIFFVMVIGASVLLARFNGSRIFLFLPAVMFFVAAPAALPWGEGRLAEPGGPRRQERWRDAFIAVTLAVLTLQSAPAFINVLFFTYESLTQPPMLAGDDVLGRIVFGATSESADRARTLQMQNNEDVIPVILDGHTTTLDAFAIGRAFRPMQRWDTLSMSEFRDYLTDGMRAAREGCKQGDRILTLDVLNPFPLLLGWPEGGGMPYFQAGQTISDKAHPTPEKMFQNIDCVLVPKLPEQMAARNLMRDIYGAYLSQHFKPVAETALWNALRSPS